MYVVCKFSYTCKGFRYRVVKKETLREARVSALSFLFRFPVRHQWEFGEEVNYYFIEDWADIAILGIEEDVCKIMKISEEQEDKYEVVEGIWAYNHNSDNKYIVIIFREVA